MSKAEALYALTTVFALNGLCLVEDGPRFVQVVPMGDRQRVKTRAPAPEPGAELVDPQKVPAIGVSSPRPLTDRERVEHELRRVQKAVYEFMHLPNPEKPPARRLLGLYADLADKTAVSSPKFDGAGIWFRVDQPLTRRELLYAIETTFALHNLAIVPVGDRKIKLAHP